MKNIVIVGLQWGDEGKGKVVNYFSNEYDWVIRYSGGSNAGHTVYINERKYVNHLLPSVNPYGDSKGYLGPGMVINLDKLLDEIRKIETDFPGIAKRFYVDLNSSLVLSWHILEDELIENMRKEPLGTTRNGIGPSYMDKISRDGIRIFHILDEKELTDRIENLYHLKMKLYGGNFENPESLKNRLLGNFEELKKFGVNFTTTLDMKEEFEKSRVLFEGSQGVLLDINFGTYPYVTSSSCTSWGIFEGFQFLNIDEVFGVFKAYVTRVGNGPFPTEIEGDVADIVRRRGMEYGATTGRPRRIGWLDIPALRYSILSSSVSKLILTKADILKGLDRIKVCVEYEVEGVSKRIPTTPHDFERAIPVYHELSGWKDLNDVNFEKFLEFVENETGVEVKYISYGPGSEEMIER